MASKCILFALLASVVAAAVSSVPLFGAHPDIDSQIAQELQQRLAVISAELRSISSLVGTEAPSLFLHQALVAEGEANDQLAAPKPVDNGKNKTETAAGRRPGNKPSAKPTPKPGSARKPSAKPSSPKPGSARKPSVKPSTVKPGNKPTPKPGAARKPSVKPTKPGRREVTKKPGAARPNKPKKGNNVKLTDAQVKEICKNQKHTAARSAGTANRALTPEQRHQNKVVVDQFKQLTEAFNSLSVALSKAPSSGSSVTDAKPVVSPAESHIVRAILPASGTGEGVPAPAPATSGSDAAEQAEGPLDPLVKAAIGVQGQVGDVFRNLLPGAHRV